MSTLQTQGAPAPAADEGISLADFAGAMRTRWRLVTFAPFVAAFIALGVSFLIKPTFTARTSFLPPQQQQGAAAGAIASLGALAGLSSGIRSTGDQYVAFATSRTVASGLLDKFDLKAVYEEKLAHDALIQLANNTRVVLGKKDGIISIEVDDHDPQRAADMANAYVDEVRKLTAGLTLTEAQQRRVFFEGQLKQVRARLDTALAALQSSGVPADSIKAEPKAAVEAVARLRAELTTAEVRLQMLSSSLADNTPEVRQQAAAVARLRSELVRAGQAEQSPPGGYVGAYREFKYQEALFDLIARQYELARVDESRDGGQLQVIDKAVVPERKSKPKRSILMIVGFGLGLLAALSNIVWTLARRGPSATA